MANNSSVERAIVALTSLALNCPSTFTIAWSKEEHKEELPVLYAGIVTSLVTVLGALLGKRYHGMEIMWGGLAATMGLFTYVVFCYKPVNGQPQGNPIMFGNGAGGSDAFQHILMI